MENAARSYERRGTGNTAGGQLKIIGENKTNAVVRENEGERRRQKLQIIGQPETGVNRRPGGVQQNHLQIIGQSELEFGNRTREATMRRQQIQNQRRREQRRREQRRKAKRRRRLLLSLQCLLVLAIVLLFANIGMHLKDMEQKKEPAMADAEVIKNPAEMMGSAAGIQGGDYIGLVGLDEVEAPAKREPEEVLEKLGELAEDSPLIKEILQNAAGYPDNMLEALANNPEMADFVAGYRNADGSVNGGLTEAEMQQEHPLFLQWDPRWGYASYGDDSNIGLAGCGPTSLSMALYYLTGNETLTPDRIASYAMENGYYMSGTGTQWALMEDVPCLYGLKVDKPGISEQIMRQELDAGHVLICAMRQGDFTSAGHFIVIYGYDENGFWVNDPNCVARSKKSWSYERLGGQIKQLWAIAR